MVKLKICGLRRVKDIEVVNKYVPEYIGFVFAKSKRQVSLEEAKILKAKLHPEIKAVGVFVNESIANVCRCVEERVIDCIQLHGDEDNNYIVKLKKKVNVPIIKAFRVGSKEELISKIESLEEAPIDYYLFDTYTASAYGGSGESFDWNKLKSLVGKQIQKPYFLAGGIGSDNLKEAIAHKPYAIDMSSKLENNACFKDENKIKQIIDIFNEVIE
ncbi:phosphoribosylanthranilate isomerase [Cellulosilyticum ruminicola]|uniref:phosphoribosylanthranilate isomerase n=1 Tax=Cellulosilyticum ruminicola TaxID=425254 RepID=UPI0006D03CA4|nr:phosphoribosylanthranilate isomerase [Cellulosilyticum ruminicola]